MSERSGRILPSIARDGKPMAGSVSSNAAAPEKV